MCKRLLTCKNLKFIEKQNLRIKGKATEAFQDIHILQRNKVQINKLII